MQPDNSSPQPDDSILSWERFRTDFHELKDFFRAYLKNPVQYMNSVPNWDWIRPILLQGLVAALAGVLHGFVNRSFSSILFGLIISPIVAVILAGFGSGFFYYLFLFVFKREIPFRTLYIIFVLANLPFLVLSVVSQQLPPVDLIGGAVAGLLLIVGYSANLQIDRKQLMKWIVGLYAIFFLAWLINVIRLSNERLETKKLATPESLEILEKELKENK